MSRRTMISDHAVVRFIERVDGVDLTPVRAAIAAPGEAPAADAEILSYLALFSDISPGAVRKRMMTDALRTALACGASGVRLGAFRLVIVNGTVVTVRRNSWGRVLPEHRVQGRPDLRRPAAQLATLINGG